MAKRMGRQPEEDDAYPNAQLRSEEDDLYSVPDNLKVSLEETWNLRVTHTSQGGLLLGALCWGSTIFTDLANWHILWHGSLQADRCYG